MKSALNKGSRIGTAAAGFAVVGLLASTSLVAQVAQQGGNALDANPQVGSNGVNPNAVVPDYNRGNDIVTGDSGFNYFRGNVPYRSSRDFGDRVPSDDLFRFRANSLPSALGTQSRSAGYSSQGLSVYRSFSDTTADGLPGSRPAAFSIGGNNAIYSTQNIEAGRNYLTTPGAQINRGRYIGGFRDGDQVTTMTASPFLGMRQSTQSVEPNSSDSISSTPDASVQYDPSRFDSSMRIDRSSNFSFSKQLTPEEQSLIRPIGVQLGESLIRSQGDDRDAAGRDYSIASEAAFSKLNRLVNDPDYDPEEATGGDSAYAQIIAEIRKGQEKTADYFKPDVDDANAYNPNTVPSAEELSRARADRLRRMRELGLIPQSMTDLSNLDPNVRDGEQDADGNAQDGANDGQDENLSESELILKQARELLEEIDVAVPQVTTLAGQHDSTINTLYRKAEQLMSEGKYFDAEEAYRRIMVLDQDQPLAQIGMVNAMIGAGLTRSAAKQLRSVLLKHPELITVRYKASLLPAAKRLVDVEASLRKTMDGQGEQAARAALLLAYIGYQTHSQKLTEYGLLIGQTREPRDPVWQVLQRVWLDDNTNKGLELPRIEE